MYDTLGIQPTRWRITIKEQNRRRDYQREESTCSIGPKAEGEEEWRDVQGYKGRYRVSSFGRVFKIWSHKRGGGIMKGYIKPSGYRTVHITDQHGRSRTEYVHRLVAAAFCLRHEKATCVNHKDFTPGHDNVSNLEWVTPAENLRYSRQAGRMQVVPGSRAGELNRNVKLSNKNVIEIKRELATGKIMRELAMRFNVTIGTIAHIKHNRLWRHL